MDAPQIQYATSGDGTRIACYCIGNGPALIDLDPVPGHLLVAWDSSTERNDAITWSHNFSLVKFDQRGSGLSQRGNVPYSLDAFADDIAAVLDLFGIARTSIVAPGQSAMSAVAFAAKHPHRVHKLVLFSAFVSAEQLGQSTKAVGLRALLEHDYDMYCETIAVSMYGWSAAIAREQAAIIRAGQTHEEAIASSNAVFALDARTLLPLVTSPTLVIDVRGASIVPSSVAESLVAAIPGAQLMVFEGNVPSGDPTSEGQNSIVRSFLLDGAATTSLSSGRQSREAPAATEIILFADIAGSTRLTEHMGDAGFRERSRALEADIRAEVRAAGGTAVEGKVMGDGVMATFSSARQAIGAALRCRDASARHELPLHLGVHAGDVIREDGNVYGGAVNLAARVCDASSPGEILVSDVVRALARTSAGVTFEDRGEHALKGIEEAQHLWAVQRS